MTTIEKKASPMAVLQNQTLKVPQRAQGLMELVQRQKSDLVQLLPSGANVDRMIQAFILNVKNTPKLLDCEPASLIKALYTASCMGLEPNPYHGQLYLIPYNKEVQVIPGYKGLLKLVRNSGEINAIIVNTVHENDRFEYNLAGGDRPLHQLPEDGERGRMRFVYLLAEFKEGGFHLELMTLQEVERIRDNSQAYKSAKKYNKPSIWDEHFEEMAKKTVIRRSVKRLPIELSRQLRNATIINEEYGKSPTIDMETGEILDVWAEPTQEEPETTPTPEPGIPASLQKLVSAGGKS